jgi:antitoxin HicB
MLLAPINWKTFVESVRLPTEEERDGYLIEFLDLSHCMSDGETVEEAVADGEDAKRCWIAAMKEADRPIPPPSAEPADCSVAK